MFDYTIMTAKTPAQKRDATQISNAGGNVRRAMNFKAQGLTGPIRHDANEAELCKAIRATLALAKVKRVNVHVVKTAEWGVCLYVSPLNTDQYCKVHQVMAAIGFETSNAHHYRVTMAMEAEGFWL